MDGDLRLRAKSMDPAWLGARIRESRVRAGLTQGELGADDASTAYVSRIEAGTRRASAELLVAMAGRMKVSIDELIAPDELPGEAEATDALRLQLDYAELSLRTGDDEAALRGAAAVRAASSARSGPACAELAQDATYIEALALEASGSLENAILLLEDLVETDEAKLRWVRGMTALSRCYRVTGDLARAVDVGERAHLRMENTELYGSDEGIQLMMTVSGAHYMRGDIAFALRMCSRAMVAAERLGSTVAKASVYWNLSVYQSEQGDAAEALHLARKAIALLETSSDARNVARLRLDVGLMQLEMDPPQLEDAIHNLQQARDEMVWAGTSPADLASNQLGLAKAFYLSGDHDGAWLLADECFETAALAAPFNAAEARVVQGQIAASRGEPDAAVSLFREAVFTLSGVGADRRVAELWYQLAALLEDLGEIKDALEAYRFAAAASGIRVTQPATGLVRS